MLYFVPVWDLRARGIPQKTPRPSLWHRLRKSQGSPGVTKGNTSAALMGSPSVTNGNT
jgi:hypothetical protein